MVLLWIKVPDPGDPKRPDPTGSGSGSATLVLSPVDGFWNFLLNINNLWDRNKVLSEIRSCQFFFLVGKIKRHMIDQKERRVEKAI